MRRIWRAFPRIRTRTDSDTLGLQEDERERSLVRSSLATPEDHTIPQYVKLSDVPDPDSFQFLSENLDFVNWLVHQRVRHRQEYKLCLFCAGLDLPNEVLHDPVLTESKGRLEETSGPHCRAYASVNQDLDDDIVSLLPQRLYRAIHTVIYLDKARSCPLCENIRQLVLNLTQRRRGRQRADVKADKHSRSRILRISLLSRIKKNCEQEAVILRVDLENERWFTEIPILLMSLRAAFRSAADASGLDERYLTSAPTYVRSVPSPFVNWDIKRTWLHNLPVPNRAKDIQNLEGFKLIDVKANCIAPSPPNPRFAALSYVWGNSKQYLLQSQDVDMFEKEGSLKRISNRISLVIKDALVVCSKLDLPYLWVDSLCIVQDSPEIKYRQITGMDIIYSAAYITLVDGQGCNADAGLARVSIPNNRTTAPMVVGGFNYAVVQNPCSALDNAPWATRGWTFQELLLSTRLLVFTDATTIFCDSHRIETEYVYKVDSRSLPIDSLGGMGQTIQMFQGLKMQNESTITLRRDVIKKAYYEHHLRLVNNYIARELSRDDDIESALAGALNEERKLLGDCRHGLPISILARALLWTTPQQYGHLCPLKRRLGFTSWSWTGWKFDGRIVDGVQDLGDFLSLIHIWGFDTAGELVRLLGARTETDEGFSRNPDDYKYTWGHLRRIHPIEGNLPRPTLPKLGLPLSQYLIFWASCARIAVEGVIIEEEHDREDYGIIIESSTSVEEIGGVVLPVKWRASQPKYLEFVAIAATAQDYIQTMVVEVREGITYRVDVTTRPILRSKWLACQREEKLIVLG